MQLNFSKNEIINNPFDMDILDMIVDGPILDEKRYLGKEQKTGCVGCPRRHNNI